MASLPPKPPATSSNEQVAVQLSDGIGTARMAMPSPTPRPALPSDPPVQPRSDPREGLCRRISAAPKPSRTPAGIWSNPSFPTSPHQRRRSDGLICKLNSLCHARGGEANETPYPGLHSRQPRWRKSPSKVCSWFGWNGPPTAGIRRRPFLLVRFVVLEPEPFAARSFSGRLYCTERRSGSSIGSCGISAMTWNCSAEIRSMKRPCSTFAESFGPSHVTLNGRTFQNLEAFAPAAEWEDSRRQRLASTRAQEAPMTYSYTQISQYLRCPRQLSLPLSRRLAGERDPGLHGLRPLLRECSGRLLRARRLHRGALQGMGRVTGTLHLQYREGRFLGSALSPGRSPARTVCPG